MVRRSVQTRTRDAARSRHRIVEAAVEQFAERGFDGATLAEIGATAGLSRATPAYFFGNKEALYAAVLERVFADRDAVVRDAFAPLVAWIDDPSPGTSLERVLTTAVHGYLAFLVSRPAFVRIIQWEELSGGERLAARPGRSRAAEEAFVALRRASRRMGLRAFDPKEAVLVLTSMCFMPVAYRDTFLRSVELALDTESARRRQVRLVVGTLLNLIEKR